MHLHSRWGKKKRRLVLSVIFVRPTTETYSYFFYRFAFLNSFITFMAAVLSPVMQIPHQRVPPVTQRAHKSVILIPQGVKSTSTSIMSTECSFPLCLVRLSNIWQRTLGNTASADSALTSSPCVSQIVLNITVSPDTLLQKSAQGMSPSFGKLG